MHGLVWLLLMIGGGLTAITSVIVLIMNYINNRSKKTIDVLQMTLLLILGALFAIQGYYELLGAVSWIVEATLSITIVILSLALAVYNIKKKLSLKRSQPI